MFILVTKGLFSPVEKKFRSIKVLSQYVRRNKILVYSVLDYDRYLLTQIGNNYLRVADVELLLSNARNIIESLRS